MADIEEIIEADGSWYAKLLYDHSDQIAAGTGIYAPAEGQLYIKKERQNGHYWSVFLRINSVWEAILLL